MNIFHILKNKHQIVLPILKKRISLALSCLVAHCLPLHLVERVSLLAGKYAAVCSSRHRHAFSERVETVRTVLARPDVDAPRIGMTGILERLLDIKVYFAGPAYREWESIDGIADELLEKIIGMQARHPGQPIVLSPFHYASQYVNILVCERLRLKLGAASLSVVTAVADDIYGEDTARIPHITRLRSYMDGKQASLGIVREMKRNGIVILFADVPPCTLSTTPMETVAVELFGKAARIHNGIFRLGEKMKAVLLPYYIKFSEGRFQFTAFDAIALEQKNAPQRLAANIEAAFRDNHAQWLPSHYPSFYYFSSGK